MQKIAPKGRYRSASWKLELPVCEVWMARGTEGWGLDGYGAFDGCTHHTCEWLAHSQIRFARTRTRAELERVIWAGWERWLETLPAELRAQLQTERSSAPFSR